MGSLLYRAGVAPPSGPANPPPQTFAREADRERLTPAAVAALRNLAAAWGLTGEEAAAYATEVVRADFQEAGDEDVVRKLVADLGGRADVATIRQQMQACLLEAQRQLLNEGR